jgi:hypothetical protein
MIKSCQKYHQLKSELQTFELNYLKYKEANTALIERYEALKQSLPPGIDPTEINPELVKAGEDKYAVCADFYKKHNHLNAEIHQAKQDALAAIGRHFSALMLSLTGVSVQERFQKYWKMAGDYRLAHLDERTTGDAFDPQGRIFKAFAKAEGFSNPNLFVKTLSS